MPDDVKDIISKAVDRLSDVDPHAGASARKTVFDVIGDLRGIGMPDEDIHVIVQEYTGLTPERIVRYLKQEEAKANKLANFKLKYGLPERKRITALPAKSVKQLSEDNARKEEI